MYFSLTYDTQFGESSTTRWDRKATLYLVRSVAGFKKFQAQKPGFEKGSVEIHANRKTTLNFTVEKRLLR